MADNIETLVAAMRQASPEVIKNFLYRIQYSAWNQGFNASLDAERNGLAVNPYEALVEESRRV